MQFDELKDKALHLPMAPGVYIMRDKQDKVIYVGKAKKLKNRVSQYFQQNGDHSEKTKTMISKIDHFEVVIASSEFEALVLENALIKRYMPHYNILLKDDKGYPYLRLNMKDVYPRITVVNRIEDDGAGYYGPFGSRGTTNHLLEAIEKTLKLPNCSKVFPRDVGKSRVCLNYHMKQCAGWCQEGQSQAQYIETMEKARQLLLGNYKSVVSDIRKQMLCASDDLNFELAASLRDQLKAVESLGKEQYVTTDLFADMDVIGYSASNEKACFTVLHFRKGNLLDKEFEIFSEPDNPAEAVSSLVAQYYSGKALAPKIILLPFDIEDQALIAQLLENEFHKKITLRVPRRGDNTRFIKIANTNAHEELQRITTKEERHKAALTMLGKMLSIEMPNRIESFDISNISGTDIVASMVVYQDGRPCKRDYKRFKINGLLDQDDYGSMAQVLQRRFTDYLEKRDGFNKKPDLILIDGGMNHAAVAVEVLQNLGVSIPVFGMVKDDRHRTRALVTARGAEVAIDAQQSIFSFIGSIQEETHRFAITYHRNLRSKRLRYSQLDQISGIGDKRKQILLKHFRSISNIKDASLEQLRQVLPSDAANSVFEHFHSREEVD